jgi:hypothetical protein
MSAPRPCSCRAAALAVLAALACAAAPARAADISVSLPNVSGVPGGLVDVPISVSPGPSGFNILSIDFRLALDPVVIAASQSQPDGFVQYWGSAYSNGTSSFCAVAAAGTTPVTTPSTLVNTVRLRLDPHAVIGTTMLLTFQHFLFNEGTPTVAVTSGSVHVNAPQASAPAPGARTLGLALASGSPVRDAAVLACTLPGARATLAIHEIDGRLVRTATLAASGAWRWDLHDARGARVRPGVYLVRLDAAGERRTLRLLVVE